MPFSSARRRMVRPSRPSDSSSCLAVATTCTTRGERWVEAGRAGPALEDGSGATEHEHRVLVGDGDQLVVARLGVDAVEEGADQIGRASCRERGGPYV